MDKIKRNNAIYIAFLSISIAIMAVIIIIPMVQSMRYVRHTVDYNSIVAMGSYHIKISNATYLKDKKELYFALSAKEESNYSGSISSKPEISNYTLRYYDDNGKYHTEDMLKKYTVSQKNDFTEIITVSDIPSGYDYVYIELKCTIAAYDEPDTVDEFGDVIKGQHHDEIVKEQYFMFDKKDVRVIDSKDDNQDDMSIVIEEQTDSTSEKITTTEAKKDIKSDLKNDKKEDKRSESSSTTDSISESKSDKKKTEKVTTSTVTSTKKVDVNPQDNHDWQDTQAQPSGGNDNYHNDNTYTETQPYYHDEPAQTESPYQPPATTTTAVIKARSLKIETIYEYNDVKINVGSTAQLKAVVGPSNAVNKSVIWQSNRPDIAEVDSNGNVHGISSGKAIITVRVADNSAITASCMVTVN